MGKYHVAQICSNGHVITDSADRSPELRQEFCNKCGSPTIMACSYCETPIRGYYDVPGVIDVTDSYVLPMFCHKCGKPYPWTESRLKTAKDLVDEMSNLSSKEQEVLKQSLDDLLRDTPNTEVAASRFKRLASKAGREAAKQLRQLLVDVMAESTKRTIWEP